MLIVFDLDFTIWDAGGTWCDQTSPPFRKIDDTIEDSEGSIIYLYPDVMDILDTFYARKISMAIASRTYNPDTARRLLDLFGIRNFFEEEEIFPSSKIRHFENLQRKTRLPYDEMYFFDDEHRNIVEVSGLGVRSFLVRSGLNWKELEAIPGLSL